MVQRSGYFKILNSGICVGDAQTFAERELAHHSLKVPLGSTAAQALLEALWHTSLVIYIPKGLHVQGPLDLAELTLDEGSSGYIQKMTIIADASCVVTVYDNRSPDKHSVSMLNMVARPGAILTVVRDTHRPTPEISVRYEHYTCMAHSKVTTISLTRSGMMRWQESRINKDARFTSRTVCMIDAQKSVHNIMLNVHNGINSIADTGSLSIVGHKAVLRHESMVQASCAATHAQSLFQHNDALRVH